MIMIVVMDMTLVMLTVVVTFLGVHIVVGLGGTYGIHILFLLLESLDRL